ncbi:M24 family metallopeptidase [Bradyrhizobium sp. USDA 3315]
MAATSSAIPLTGIAFPKSEYERRQQKLFEAMARAKLDALVVTAHGHLLYLSGYNGGGGYFAPFPLILVPGRAPTYVVRDFDTQAVRANSCVDDIVGYTQQPDFAKVCADVLHRNGLQNKRVGFELGCWNLAPNDVYALQARLPDMKVADATHLVASVAAIKNDLELQVMRDAMVITDIAVRTFQASLRDGITEIEVLRAIETEVEKAGGQLRPPSTNLLFGDRTKLPHGAPSKHPLKNNQPAYMEIGGIKNGYAAGIIRSAVLGRHAETEALHELAEESLEALIAAMKPGVTAGAVNAAARKVIDKSGRPNALRSRTGYQTGINWTERGNISLEPDAADVLEAGMTFHMPLLVFGESGYLFGTSEHVVITERGAEILSRTSHALYRA